MTVLATGTRFDKYPRSASEQSSVLGGSGLTAEQKAYRLRAEAGEVMYVRSTAFVELDASQGVDRWEDTPQGPYPVPLGQPATSALLSIIENDAGLLLADLRISGMDVSRFEWHAAPRRIVIDPKLADQLILG